MSRDPGTGTPASQRAEPATGLAVAQRYEYAVIRVVPRVERGECINAGVILHCQAAGFLAARVLLSPERLLALDPQADVGAIRADLEAVELACTAQLPRGGQPAHGALGRRFAWFTSPRSTVVQPGPVHPGLTQDPASELRRLLSVLVA